MHLLAMKLYATVTSERASKGQGGKWLNIEIKDVNGTVFLLNVQKAGNATDLTVIETTKEGEGSLTYKETTFRAKGEKQKGEHGHEWDKADVQGTRWCKTCTATIDSDGGIIQ